jgi:hypothetical protein
VDVQPLRISWRLLPPTFHRVGDNLRNLNVRVPGDADRRVWRGTSVKLLMIPPVSQRTSFIWIPNAILIED